LSVKRIGLINEKNSMKLFSGVTTGNGDNVQKVPAQNFSVRAGSTDQFSGGENVDVSDVYIRDGYRGDDSTYDIGILKLSRDLTLDGITEKATKLPDSSSFNVPDGTNCYVQGWGYNPR
jgi:hypothetical protein